MPPATLPMVHLVGSVPLASTEQVFTTLAAQLPGLLGCIPDGETGNRGNFTGWQRDVLPPQIILHQFLPEEPSTVDPTFTLTSSSIQPTGYDRAAVASYAIFRRLRDVGIIPPGVRFQVCLPTPINVVGSKVAPQYVVQAETLYEARLLEALHAIQDAIPLDDLAIQWDMALEMAHMEHAYGPRRTGFTMLTPYYAPVKEGIACRMARLAAAVHDDVPMGFHFCYGDFGHQHFVQPEDAGLLVDLMHAVNQSVTERRAVQWMHLPVPRSRVDDAYYAPLRRLTIGRHTTIFLGLVHAGDEDGTRERMAAAQRALGERRFGVATECGLGRTPAGDLDSIFRICREVTKDA